MNRVLADLKPEKVFSIFEDICAIPHGSGNTKAISDFCVNFARERGFDTYQDEMNNVIIKKPASPGYEYSQPVVLQGHLDMVCEKEPGLDFDFERDGLKLKLDSDFVSACGTTLGGDDGVAIAIALSILDDSALKTPPLEVIFTSDEETGMYGAKALDGSLITAKRFISLDCGKEGAFTAGCAGGVCVDIKLPVKTEKVQKEAYKVEVSGLCGGHSGEEIHKGGLNANKVLGEFLSTLKEVRISKISGGDKDNAIPVYAYAVIDSTSDVVSMAREFRDKAVVPADRGLKITVSRQTADTFCTSASSEKIIDLLCALPFGVQAMSKDIEGVVETSLNVGVIGLESDTFSVLLNLRSSVASEKEALKGRVIAIGESFGGSVTTFGDYPAWQYRKDSPLRETVMTVFKETFGGTPEVRVIHAGLECGIFSGKIADIDAVAMGPDMFDIHTARERFSVSSLARTYTFVCKILEALK
ncbi:MAG: aminoacyl-histidine dipeptidase [Clostridia bacterium]|nr:aminoacyl-histidine dipeptidase [Clostridia bacterium]